MNPIHVGQEAAIHTRPEKEIPDCRLCWSWKIAEIFENLPTKSRNYVLVNGSFSGSHIVTVRES
jgi:hypothetical protein